MQDAPKPPNPLGRDETDVETSPDEFMRRAASAIIIAAFKAMTGI